MMDFQRKYNELKMKSYDIALRISDIESALGYDNSKIVRLKSLFSKLQSSINFAVYYNQHRMAKESSLHIDYAYQVVEYIYAAFEKIEVPQAEVEVRLDKSKDKKESKEKKGFKIRGLGIRMSYKPIILLVLAGIAYCLFVYWFFIRGTL